MFRSKSQFEKVLEKATSNLLLEPDFDSMLQLCDMIRGGEIKSRDAVAHMKTRIREEKNPNVRYFALSVLDTAMKNCGEAVHEEVISQEFCEELQEMVKTTSAERVKGKVLEMVQSWGLAFKDKTEFKVATNLYNIMKAEGYEFPPPTNTADMFKSERAPVWKEGDECSKCKSEFGLVQRKHHCRACGGIFCNRCTSKQSIIPKFGIEKEVRVCDKCYDEINSKSSSSDPNSLPSEYLNSSLAKESQSPPARNEQALKEEEELQIALAMSLNEQENQSRSKKQDVYATVDTSNIKPPQVKPVDDSNLDPELAKYLNRNYWERKKDSQDKPANQQETKSDPKKNASAPPSETKDEPETPVPIVSENTEPKEPPKEEEQSLQNGLDIEDNEEFMHNLRTSVEIFMNRMRSDQMRNRSIANDSAVQSLFQSINTMHPTLLQYMNDLEEKRLQYEALQDKLTQIRDARAALDALREEHKEKLRRAAEEAERLRQIQMAQKLEIMRQKKQEYLAYQRQIALQRMQEQEAARRARLEKQKQFIMQRAMQPAMIVQGYNTQYLPPQPNMGEGASEMQQPTSMQTAGYPTYSGPGYPTQNMTQSATQPPYGQQIGIANQPGHFPPQHMQHPGQYQPEYSTPVTGYQQGVQDTTAAQISGGMQPQESFNMSGMASALSQQQPQMQGQQPQVVATAPPPTPQATPTPQQMTQPVSQPHMIQIGAPPQQQQMQGQQFYQPSQDQLPPTTQGTTMLQQEAQNLLISFD